MKPTSSRMRPVTKAAVGLACKLAEIPEDQIRAVVSAARLSNPADAEHLLRTLSRRRPWILRIHLLSAELEVLRSAHPEPLDGYPARPGGFWGETP